MPANAACGWYHLHCCSLFAIAAHFGEEGIRPKHENYQINALILLMVVMHVTTDIFFSTNKLGEVTDQQLQLMLNRFGLGRLTSAAKTAKGVGNQTMFVRSTAGEYVLKGNPLYAGQFVEEQFYVDNLLARTKLPLPAPYLVDESPEVFGWAYAVMRRLPGRHLTEPALAAGLSAGDREQIAELLAVSLVQLHRWKVDYAGEYDPKSRQIRPFQGSYRAWLYARIRYWLGDAGKYSLITQEDMQWVESLLDDAEGAFERLDSPSYVMGDFKADNILMHREANHWQISGVLDFTNGYFGDGLADLPKIAIMYLNAGEAALAERFVRTYLDGVQTADCLAARLGVHLLMQLTLDWGCAKATHTVGWDEQLPFSEWAKRYTAWVEKWLA